MGDPTQERGKSVDQSQTEERLARLEALAVRPKVKTRARPWGKGPGDVLADGKTANHPDRDPKTGIVRTTARSYDPHKPNTLFR